MTVPQFKNTFYCSNWCTLL